MPAELGPEAEAFLVNWASNPRDLLAARVMRDDLAALLAAERRRALLEAAEIAEHVHAENLRMELTLRKTSDEAVALRARAEEGGKDD